MIQVQIASQLTTHGVDGIRWVLVEGADVAFPPAAPASVMQAAVSSAAASGGAQRPSRALTLALLKLLVMGVGVGLALWVAQATLGSARLPWWEPAGAGTQPRERLPTHTLPGAAPAPPPASATQPLVTAVVS
jgi:hypothetical protein